MYLLRTLPPALLLMFPQQLLAQPLNSTELVERQGGGVGCRFETRKVGNGNPHQAQLHQQITVSHSRY